MEGFKISKDIFRRQSATITDVVAAKGGKCTPVTINKMDMLVKGKRKMPDNRKSLPDLKGVHLPASATLEAALVMPLFIYGVMAVMYVLQMVGIQIHIQEALYNTGRELAKAAYAADCVGKGLNRSVDAETEMNPDVYALVTKGASLGAAQALFLREVGGDFAAMSHIAGGNAGFVMLGSAILEGTNEIELKVSYLCKNPFDVFGLGMRRYTQSIVTSAWLGSENTEWASGLQQDGEEYVYIATYSEVCHKSKNCTYLMPSVIRTDMAAIAGQRNAGGAKYYPCEYCKASASGQSVYITDYGTRYHTKRDCAMIYHHIMKIRKSSVGNMGICSKCGG